MSEIDPDSAEVGNRDNEELSSEISAHCTL